MYVECTIISVMFCSSTMLLSSELWIIFYKINCWERVVEVSAIVVDLFIPLLVWHFVSHICSAVVSTHVYHCAMLLYWTYHYVMFFLSSGFALRYTFSAVKDAIFSWLVWYNFYHAFIFNLCISFICMFFYIPQITI